LRICFVFAIIASASSFYKNIKQKEITRTMTEKRCFAIEFKYRKKGKNMGREGGGQPYSNLSTVLVDFQQN
jgi:hypothetical protein